MRSLLQIASRCKGTTAPTGTCTWPIEDGDMSCVPKWRVGYSKLSTHPVLAGPRTQGSTRCRRPPPARETKKLPGRGRVWGTSAWGPEAD